MTDKELDLIKKILSVKGDIDKYVILCEDEQGRYIKYAFIEGEPHDNRCLSWYDKLQPNALKRNGHNKFAWRLHEIGKVYRLNSFSCGNDNEKGDGHCSPGHPKKECLKCQAKKWTYEEPVKCACWYLEEVDFNSINFRLNLKEIKELVNYEF